MDDQRVSRYDFTNCPVVVDDKGNVLGGNERAMMLQRVYGAKNAEAAIVKL